MDGKLLVGYRGHFRASTNWVKGASIPRQLVVDMWPNIQDYPDNSRVMIDDHVLEDDYSPAFAFTSKIEA